MDGSECTDGERVTGGPLSAGTGAEELEEEEREEEGRLGISGMRELDSAREEEKGASLRESGILAATREKRIKTAANK